MSYTEEQLWSLLDDAYGMPYGPGQIALIEQIIGHADAMGSTQLSFAARLQGTTSYVHGGEPVRSFATFAWCLAEFDRNPTAYQREQRILLWQFKYMISAMTKFPEIPLDRTYAALDDMQRRWQETGHSMHAVFAYRHVVANHIGDLEAAERYYTQWCAAPRDDLSDCVGCDPSSKAWWLSQRGRDEEAVSLGEPVLSGRLTCSEQPQSMLETLMFPYLRTGRLDQARDAHRRAYRLHRPNLADMASIAEHIDFCARTGNEPRALEIIERHLGWLDRAPSPWAALLFASSSARALRRAHALNADLTLFRPAHGDREASRVSATVLADELVQQATELGARFDERNGTPRIGDVVRRRLSAEPLVEYLPLSPTAARRAPHAEQSTVVPPRDPGTASVTDIFAKTPTPSTTDTVSPPAAPVSATPAEISVPGTSGPDELLDLIEEHYEADRDDHAAAGLDAFDARYGSVELTTWQRARLVDARASRLAGGQDFASAERFWREAAELYAASEDPEGEHRALARAGAARSWRGEQADGLPLLEEATEWLLAHGSSKSRVGAATRLAIVYHNARRPEDALAVLDRATDGLDDAPLRARARHAVVRLLTLGQLRRGEEIVRTGPAAIALAESAGLGEETARAHTTLAAALEGMGALARAADHLGAAVALLTDERARSELRLVRASMLARTERAAEAVDVLIEAVADRTAHGDEESAADARHHLATAYLNTDRLLDAAEVAEEELAYRLRSDSGRPDAEPSATIGVRRLLATVYRSLGQPDEAIAQLDAVAADCERNGNSAGAGQMNEEAGEILNARDRDAEAAARFLAAAELFGRADLPYEAIRNRCRHALSATWAQGPEQGLAALADATAMLGTLPGEPAAIEWERARIAYNEARIRWRGGELSTAAQLAGQAAETWAGVGEPNGAAEARILQARILLDDGAAPEAETAARQALSGVSDSGRRASYVAVLDSALRAAGRTADADAVWAEHGLPRPSTEDGVSDA